MTNVDLFPGSESHISIKEPRVTLERLAELLGHSGLGHELTEDETLYVGEGLQFPVCLIIDSPNHLIQMLTCVTVQKGEAARSRINKLNRDYILPQFHYDDGNLWGHYWLSFEGGMNPHQFSATLKRFAGAFATAVDDHKAALVVACDQ